MACELPKGVDVMAMCHALAESGGEFAKQFDRDAPEFHGDIKAAVPTGGQRVPESMGGKDAANWRDLPEAPIAIEPEYGPEYHEVMGQYEKLNQAKKAISTLNKPVENAMKVRLQYKDAEGDDKTALQSRLAGEENVRNGALSSATEILLHMDKAVVSERTIACIEEVVSRGRYEFEDKASFGDYMLVLQRANQAIFADQKKLLAKIKEIKKAARDAAKQVEKVATPARAAAEEPAVGA